MTNVVIVEAARTPIGRRRGALAGLHPATLLGFAQRAVLERAGVAPEEIGQIVGGVVTQAGEQSTTSHATRGCTRGCRTPRPPRPSTARVVRRSRLCTWWRA